MQTVPNRIEPFVREKEQISEMKLKKIQILLLTFVNEAKSKIPVQAIKNFAIFFNLILFFSVKISTLN